MARFTSLRTLSCGMALFLLASPALAQHEHDIWPGADDGLSLNRTSSALDERIAGDALQWSQYQQTDVPLFHSALAQASEGEEYLLPDDWAGLERVTRVPTPDAPSPTRGLEFIDPPVAPPAVAPEGAMPPPPQWTFVVTGYGVDGDLESRNGRPRIEYQSYGLLIGADKMISESILIGFFGGVQWTDAQTKAFAMSIEESQINFGGYIRHMAGAHHTQLTVTAGYNFYDAERGSGATVAHGDYDGYQALVYAEHGVTLPVGQWGRLQPFGALQYYHMYTEDYTETGAGMNLTFESVKLNSLRTVIGSRLQIPVIQQEQFQGIAEVRAMWMHELLDPRFKNSPAEWGRDSMIVGGGLTLLCRNNAMVILDYSANFNDHNIEHVGSAVLRINF